jgi:glycerophosphoryl diester phosphodiesterase
MIRFALAAALIALPAQAFDLQGHRGARGLVPENTLPAFQRAPEIRTMHLSTPRTLAPAGRGRPSPWVAGFAPELQLGSSVPKAIHAAGGRIWGPDHQFLTSEQLAEARALGIAVIPWTVNDPAMMVKLLEMGVDGIISDRPDLVQIELKKRR